MDDPATRPPAWATALLSALLPDADASTVLGDLEEAYARRVGSLGPAPARRWYCAEAARYALRLAPTKLRTMTTHALGDLMTRDLRFAVRRLVRRPGFTAVVVATLALGIGANATIFSIVDAVLFRPLPVQDAETLVQVYGSSERDGNAGGLFQGFLPISYPTFEDLERSMTSVDGMFVHSQWPVSVLGGDEPERIDGVYVSASYFDVLGVRPMLGRAFRPDEDRHPGADAVVVLRHGYWAGRFGGDEDVIGESLVVNGRALEIIGVAPPGFRGTSSTLQPDIFVPVSMIGDVPPWGPLWTERALRFFNVGARIASGRSPADVREELNAMALRLAEIHPDSNRDRGLQMLPMDQAKVDPNRSATLGRTGGVLLVIAGLVLLIACMNVANLLLGRALSRGDELAVRTSLGATRGRLVREMSVESGLLFVLGAGTGIAVASRVLGAVDGVRPPAFFGGALELGLDPRVIAFTAAATLVCVLVFGVGPAARTATLPAASGLRARGSSGSRSGALLREGLVLGQVALSVVALALAGTFLQSLRASRAIDPGFEIERLGMMDVDLAAQGYDEDERRAFYRRMTEVAAALPGVESAVVGGERPLGPAPLRRVTRVDEDRSAAGSGHFVRVEPVSGGFLERMGIAVLQGRGIDPSDDAEGRLVAVVNRRLAELLWQQPEAVGEQLVVSLVDDPIEVVGVADVTKAVSLTEDPQPTLYVPLEQHPSPTATLFVRLRGDEALEEARRAVQALDPSLPVFDVTTAAGLMAEDLWTARATVRVLALFGLVGLLLAGVGIYGVVAHSVRERTRELALRVALGAGQGGVLRAAVLRTLVVAGIGAGIGGLAAVLTVDAFSGLLVGVGSGDPRTLAAVVAGLLAVAGLAAYLPARRATRVDLMVVLRGEE